MFSFDFGTYEDVIELNLDEPVDLDLQSLNWIQYNPRKSVNRTGCSITSLTGDDNGIPDLDSLVEYNRLNGTNYAELDFRKPTAHARPFEKFLSEFVCGRSHYLKLSSGGFFPWHRDNDLHTFRIIYTIQGCQSSDLVWVHNDRVLELQNSKWYFINTKKKHCLFSFSESTMAVFNVHTNLANIQKFWKSTVIK